MKMKKWIVRIFSGLLIVAMLIGAIVPYVFASEVSSAENAEVVVEETTETNDEIVKAEPEVPSDEVVTTIGAIDETVVEMPTDGLPVGFEYVNENDTWVIKKTEDNTSAAILLNNVPDTFDATSVKVFVANLETKQVQHFSLDAGLSYITTMDLADGYYVIYGGEYAWCDSLDNAYVLNDTNPLYVYVGSEYDPNKFEDVFLDASDIILIDLTPAPDGMNRVKHSSNLLIGDEDLSFPNEFILATDSEIEAIPEDETIEEEPIEANKEEPKGTGLKDILKESLKKSSGLLIAVAVLFIAIKIIEFKKKEKLSKQSENDKYDDKRVE